MTRSNRFCLIWLASLLLIELLVGGINFVIDPYDVFGSARIVGLNEFKPQAKKPVAPPVSAGAPPETTGRGQSPGDD